MAWMNSFVFKGYIYILEYKSTHLNDNCSSSPVGLEVIMLEFGTECY